MEKKTETTYEKIHLNWSRKVETRGRYKSFRCPDSLFKELEAAASQLSMNTSELIREALVAHLGVLKERRFYSPKIRGKGVVQSQESWG